MANHTFKTMDILTETRDGILRISFNRPDKKNAITAAMYAALTEALYSAEGDVSIRAVLFTGQPDCFSAGNDLEDFLRHPPQGDDSPVLRFLWALSHASKPLVAAVSGIAVGVGTTLLLHCDLVYAADNARFSLPFAKLGLCPEAASSLLLPQLAGYQRAAEKLLLGEAFDAQEAQAMGLVNKVLPIDAVLAYAEQQCAKLAALPAPSLRITKRLMRGGNVAAVEAQMALENTQFLAMLGAPEAQEAFTAFMQKRKPVFDPSKK